MKQLLTIPEAARLLNVSNKTTYRMVFDGYIAALKIRGSLRIKMEDLERLVNEARDQYETENGFCYDFFREGERNGSEMDSDGQVTLTRHDETK